MFTQHPTLLIGPADWDEAHAPKAEFEGRIAALWDTCPQARQAIVFGSAAEHAALAYFTHFVPKLEPAIALIGRDGERRILFGGGPNMIEAMRPLTFVDTLAPIGALTKLVGGWQGPLLVGGGAMSRALRTSIDTATGGTAVDATAAVEAMMRHKSAVERTALRSAAAVLAAAMSALRDAARAGRGATDVLLAGERAAIDAGAQDVRSLISLDGGRTLRPFERREPKPVAPLTVYMAVRRFNYWAEGFATVDAAPSLAAQTAQAALTAAVGKLSAGAPLDAALAYLGKIEPFQVHPVTTAAPIAAMGLAIGEAPATCETGDVLSVRAGVSGQHGRHAIVSALVAVGERSEVLWS